MEELNLLNGNNRANRIFPDGYILNASENELKEYKYRFNNVDYYFETTRIILNLGNGVLYLPYGNILRAKLFLDDNSFIKLTTINGVLGVSTRKTEKAINFADLLEIASARAGNHIRVEVSEALKFKGGGIGIGF